MIKRLRRALPLALLHVMLLLAPAGAALAEPLRLVALGDSLTAGYGLPAEAAFPAVLERALRERGIDVEIANAGVSGDTASGGLARLDWSVPDGTDGVILALGANDMLRGVAPEVTRKALEDIVTRLAARGIPVMLVGMVAAPNLGEDFRRRFDAIYKDIAAERGLVFYPFFLEEVAADPGLNLPDGMHPNAEGVKRIVARMLPTVERFVSSLPSRG
ncbi:arylesterase [Chelatococcus composti]|jgi:acyl-CoA thioesterase-1|uniref:Acyl-CoA thioesterase-1 n=1 Tax=Chelatococcus composti TaxID=1743235 RepID=A0A841K9J9_9HYPH|nr:acyl-CoA thioesterase-1 [Chelatococcus composti]GGG45768.1 arylesterase [Chelatococcus composti]